MSNRRFPNLFIAGAPKCGTTSLAYYLGQHDNIFAPAVKEPMYFGSDLAMKAPRIRQEDYMSLYKNWKREKYSLDATPAYLVSSCAAQEIRDASPQSKIIICVRNPVDAVVSAFHHNKYRLSENAKSIEEALDREAGRKLAGQAPRFGTLQTLLYTELFSYSTTIPRFASAFGDHSISIVVLDDLSANPTKVFEELSTWLGIESDCTADFTYHVQNSGAKARFNILNQLSIHPPPWVGLISQPLLSKEARRRIRQTIQDFNRVRQSAPTLRSETRARLERAFAGDVEWLSRYLNRDLTHWLDSNEPG